jgi:hypothetical protein
MPTWPGRPAARMSAPRRASPPATGRRSAPRAGSRSGPPPSSAGAWPPSAAGPSWACRPAAPRRPRWRCAAGWGADPGQPGRRPEAPAGHAAQAGAAPDRELVGVVHEQPAHPGGAGGREQQVPAEERPPRAGAGQMPVQVGPAQAGSGSSRSWEPPLRGACRGGARPDQARRIGPEHLLELVGGGGPLLVGQQRLQPHAPAERVDAADDLPCRHGELDVPAFPARAVHSSTSPPTVSSSHSCCSATLRRSSGRRGHPRGCGQPEPVDGPGG